MTGRAKDGPVLSWRERRALQLIEVELRKDKRLDESLRTMRSGSRRRSFLCRLLRRRPV